MSLPLAIVSPVGAALELSESEQLLLYNMEVMGMTVTRAAKVAGIAGAWAVLKKPAVAAAREQLRVAMRNRSEFTREDVIAGMKDAIDMAKIIADPMAQIAGWKEIAKLQGFDKDTTVNININGKADQIERQIQGLSTARLLELSGDSEVLDGDFYKVSD